MTRNVRTKGTSTSDTTTKARNTKTSTTTRKAAPKAVSAPATRNRRTTTASPAEVVASVPAPVAWDASDPVVRQANYQRRGVVARITYAEHKDADDFRICEGDCGESLHVTKFPTTKRLKDGSMGRGKTCRSCRDAGKK